LLALITLLKADINQHSRKDCLPLETHSCWFLSKQYTFAFQGCERLTAEAEGGESGSNAIGKFGSSTAGCRFCEFKNERQEHYGTKNGRGINIG